MKLDNYSQLIHLTDAFTPCTELVQEPLELALQSALNDQELQQFVSQYALPDTAKEQRAWLQAALTVRPPGNLPPDLITAMDQLLQDELKQKAITDAANLPRLQGTYPAAINTSIWNGDIATLKIDAITNAANSQMLGCFQPFHACIDNVINNAAGPQLREDCDIIMRAQGHLEKTGSAKITRAYNLPSKFVLHTVGPIIQQGQIPSPEQAALLANCYQSCLSLSAEAGARSIALCGVSTGVFGYPPELAAQVALTTVADWFDANPGKLDHVVFNTYGDAATQLYLSLTENWSTHD